jgi:hypothetical protein
MTPEATLAETVAWVLDEGQRTHDALRARGLPINEAMVRAYESALAQERTRPEGAERAQWRAHGDQLRQLLEAGRTTPPPNPPGVIDREVAAELAAQRARRITPTA